MKSIPAIKMLEITKRFDNLVANDNVSLNINKGEIHALVGENGAGKSTLMKILFGLERADSGSIQVNGKNVTILNPADAMHLGIGMVHQSFKLVESLSVAENVVLGNEPNNRYGLFKVKDVIKDVQEIANRFKLNVNPLSKIADLSVGQRQTVEILKVLYRNPEIILLDEPTSILTPAEVNLLFKSLREFASIGKTIVLVTHRLREVFNISEYVSVMRKGKLIGTFLTKNVKPEQISHMIVGRKIIANEQKHKSNFGSEVLGLDKVSCLNDIGGKALNSLSFSVHKGEVLGIAGVSGNGQSELVEVLSGLRSFTSGTICCVGNDFPSCKPRAIRELGVGYIPEDRLKTGLAIKAKIEENLILNKYYCKPFMKFGLLNQKFIDQYSKNLIKHFDIRTPNGKMPAESLSGGNQQKVVVARELSEKPPLLILHEPTCGLDVGAIEFVHSGILNHAQNGGGVLLVSTDLDEILRLSNRILVIYKGEIVKEFGHNDSISDVEIGHYMLGLKNTKNA